MRQIKKILFPVDFSDSCLGAARHVEALAGRFEAEIMLLHAVGIGEHTLARERNPATNAQLDAFLATELKYFTTHRVCVTADDPARAIAEAGAILGPGSGHDADSRPRFFPQAFARFGHDEDAT